MALLIKKPITILGDIVLKEVYLRLSYILSFDGKSIDVTIKSYASKGAYIDSLFGNEISIPGIKKTYIIEYDRKKDGLDILSFIHNKIKEDLTTDKYQEISNPELEGGLAHVDDKIGMLVFDKPERIKVLSQSKFAELLEVIIVDLN